MCKICIIGVSNIKHISLISLYTRFFDTHEIPYDVIYMDRYGIDEKTTAKNQYCYKAGSITNRLDKARAFFGFRHFVKGLIRKKKYELLITWQTTTAYLLVDILLHRYRGRYVVNIRDYVAEKNKLIRPFITRLVNNSAMNAISSEGFMTFLPKAEYVRVNSINDDVLADTVVFGPRVRKTPYIIGFAGNCRFFRESYKLIDALGNDNRFELWYCGTNSEVLAKYAREHEIYNVKTRPAFSPNDTISVFTMFDIVNSAFGNDAMDNSTLMPIRLYTAISMHLPMLVSSKTQLSKEVEHGGIGFVIQDYDSLGDSLFSYLETLDYDELSQRCDEYISTARLQNDDFFNKIASLTEGLNG